MTLTAESAPNRQTGRAALLLAFPIALLAVGDVNVDRWGWTSEGIGPTSRSVALFVIWLGALLAAMYLIRSRSAVSVPLAHKLMGLFLVWSLLSSVLGETPERSTAAWLGFASLALFTLSFVEHHGPWPVLTGIFLACIALAAASLIGDALGEELRINGRLGGYTFEPNLLGQLSGLGLVAGATLAVNRILRPEWVLCSVPFLAFAAIESGTRTTLPALAVAALFLVPRDRRLRAAVIGAAAAFTFVVSIGVDTIADTAQRTDTENLARLSGRVEVWDWSLDLSSQNPILGYGIASATFQLEDARSTGLLSIESASSHNLVLELWREVGIVGIGLFAAVVTLARPWYDDRVLPILGFLAVSALTMPTAGLPGIALITWLALVARPQPTSAPYP